MRVKILKFPHCNFPQHVPIFRQINFMFMMPIVKKVDRCFTGFLIENSDIKRVNLHNKMSNTVNVDFLFLSLFYFGKHYSA